MNKMEDYTQYGEEWEKEMMKMNKKELVSMFKRTATKLKQYCLENNYERAEEVDVLIQKIKDIVNQAEEYPTQSKYHEDIIQGMKIALKILEGKE